MSRTLFIVTILSTFVILGGAASVSSPAFAQDQESYRAALRDCRKLSGVEDRDRCLRQADKRFDRKTKRYKNALTDCRRLPDGAGRDQCVREADVWFARDNKGYKKALKNCARLPGKASRDKC
ncbi:MAG: hypothetical protein V3S45_05305, partial [Kiloniellales bacterium]